MNKSNRNDLGRYVQRILQQKKMTLREVERKADGQITNSYISKILNGTVTNLTVEKIAALARGLGVDGREIFDIAYGESEDLVHGAHSDNPPDALMLIDIMQKIALSPQLMEILQEVIELYPEEYPVVMKYVTVLNERKRKSQHSKNVTRDKASV
jgi:transcriptional regulator with XRE-family HTH domain